MHRTLSRLSAIFPLSSTTRTQPNPMTTSPSQVVNTRPEWRRELASLPTLEQNDGKIPSVFLAHGQPMLLYPPHLVESNPMISTIGKVQGPGGLLCQFLEDFGPVLMEKYKPRAVVVLSAHYETRGGGVVTDYGDENPLLYDFFGFPDELYQIRFGSSGDSKLSREIVELLRAAGIHQARLTSKLEARGKDGRGFDGPGLDHGVFVPFKLMFGERAPVPIVQVSIPDDLSPRTQRALGEALEPLRSRGVLIVSGGLTIHTFRDFTAFSPATAKPIFHSFESSIVSAVREPDYATRSRALDDLTRHEGFRAAHPREEHFVPIFVAAGAARESEERDGKASRVVCGLYGAKTVVFGV